MKTLLYLLIFIVASVIIFPVASFSGQFDEPYYAYEKRHKDAWEKQDSKIDQKLAALEKKFGKKPNIIYKTFQYWRANFYNKIQVFCYYGKVISKNT